MVLNLCYYYCELFWSTKPSSRDRAYCLIPTTFEVSYNSIRIAYECCIIEGKTAHRTPPAN